jgi:aspartate/methionine/tyrosine aminotransferase
MTEEFYRIRRLPPYVFAEVNAMKAAARGRGEDIVDLGMGRQRTSSPSSPRSRPSPTRTAIRRRRAFRA